MSSKGLYLKDLEEPSSVVRKWNVRTVHRMEAKLILGELQS